MPTLAVAAVSARMLADAAARDGYAVRALDCFGDLDTRRASGGDRAAVRSSLAEADVLLATAAAGVQVVSREDLGFAGRLKVAADVNAVPPEGIAGVGVMDDAKPLAGTSAVGIGALAIGNVKYQTQHRLLVQMRDPEKGPVTLSFGEAFAVARDFLAEKR